MPILIRPVREQLEHDRIIRLLQAKWKRKHDVQANVGDEQTASVKVGPAMALYPDLVISTLEAPRRLQTVIEVETGESVNNLEAMAQWAQFARTKAAFHLYVPAAALDIARRLCQEYQILPSELWSYSPIGDQLRFTLVQKHAGPEAGQSRVGRSAARSGPTKAGPPRAAKARKPSRPAPEAAPGRRAATAAKRASKSTSVRAVAARPSAARKAGSKVRSKAARTQKRR